MSEKMFVKIFDSKIQNFYEIFHELSGIFLFQDIVQPVATGTAQGRFNPIESRKPSNLTPMKLGCPIRLFDR